jgi:Domain of unknown function (DUF4785) C-terminal domain
MPSTDRARTTNRSGRRWSWIAALAALAIAAVFLWPRGDAPAAKVAAAPAPARASRAAESGVLAGGLVIPRHVPVTSGLGEGAATKARQVLADYEAFAVYPPWSRPADGSQVHVVEWNKGLDSGSQAFSTEDGDEVRADLVTDRMYAGPGQPITARVRVWRVTSSGKAPVDFDATGEIEVWDPSQPTSDGFDHGWRRVGVVPFGAPREEDGMAVSTAQLTPSAIAELASTARDARLIAWVSHGHDSHPYAIALRYSAGDPVVVLGRGAERVGRSGLEVDLRVDVKVAGATRLQATLYDRAGEQAIAVFDRRVELAAGRHTVTLAFFGRIIRERGLTGPYTVRSIHGISEVPGAEPPTVFWSWPEVVQTRAYGPDDFSGDAWSSPEKDRKVALYQHLIDGFDRGDR